MALDETLCVQLLGTVAARRGDAELDLGPGRQRAVFAVLATCANQVVSREVLIDAVWGESPPRGAGQSLYSYVSRLRQALEPDRSRWTDGQVLVSAGAGYSLRLEPGALDVQGFDHFRQVAQQCWNRRDIVGARTALDEALALWHAEEALGGVDCPFVTPHRQRLGELRLAALEQRAETMIMSSDVAAVPELYRLAEAYPLRESLVGLLMTALRRAGRDADAVEVLQETQRLLIAELGIEPGPALRRIHDEIVAGGGVREPPHSRVAPDPPAFLVGREAELAALRARLADVRCGRGSTVWIEGGQGCGKSGLLAAAFAEADRPDSGCRLFWAIGDEVGRERPLGLMLSCLGVNAELDAELRRPATTSNAWQPEPAAVDRLAGYVDRLASAGPVVLVLDGLHWADDTSLLLWHRLTKVARRSPLLLVGTCRPVPRRTEIDRMRSAVRSGGGVVLRLDPLNPSQSTELTHRLLGARPGPGLVATVDCAAGNPLFLLEVVEALVRDGTVTINDGIAELTESAEQLADVCPPALRSVVTKRLGTLTETTREALNWAAVLGAEFDLGDLATVMGRSASELIAAVEEATMAGALTEVGLRFAFRHSLVRRALYVSMPFTVRAASHRQAAEMLDAAGAAVERVAEQLLAAPADADAWMTKWLLANVNTIASRSPETAIELLSRVPPRCT
jgi:DNA-binding SARP family transcriptional activator